MEQLHGVAWAQPGAQVPWLGGAVGQGADAYAHDLEAVFVGVEPAEVLDECLADPVEGVWAWWRLGADALAGGVEAGDVRAWPSVGAGG